MASSSWVVPQSQLLKLDMVDESGVEEIIRQLVLTDAQAGVGEFTHRHPFR